MLGYFVVVNNFIHQSLIISELLDYKCGYIGLLLFYILTYSKLNYREQIVK